jgi:hypothetical protein
MQEFHVDFNEAIKAHMAWKTKLTDAIAAQATLDAEIIARDDCCALGKWLHGEESRAQFGALRSHAQCIDLHADFHKNAGKVASAINARRYDEAKTMLGSRTPYSRTSSAVIIAITALKREAAEALAELKTAASGTTQTPFGANASDARVFNMIHRNAQAWPRQLVAVASITTELGDVVDIAKEISLAAANAKAIAFRAGDKAKGFLPITDFINELAKETMGRVAVINKLAITLFLMTVHDYRKTTAYEKIEEVIKLSGGAVYAHSMRRPHDTMQDKVLACRRQFRHEIARLLSQLEDVMNNARTARIIATYSRIEASQAGEYLQSLQMVAENVDHAGQTIHDNVQRCMMTLIRFQNN